MFSNHKKGEADLLAIALLLAGIVAVGYIAVNVLHVKIGAGSIGGFTSISIANILTNPGGTLPSGEYWLLNFVAENPRADELYGTASDGQLTYQNYKLGNGFSLDVKPTAPQACTAALGVSTDLNQRDIYQISWVDATFSYYASSSDLDNWCYNTNVGFARVQKSCNLLVNCEHRCYKKLIVQQLGNQVSQTNIAYQEQVNLTNLANGKASIVSMSPISLEANLPNPDNPSQIIGKVAWSGNLISNNAPCTYTFNGAVIPTYAYPRGWYLVDQTIYASYATALGIVNNWAGSDYTSMQQKVQQFNTASANLAYPTTNTLFSSASFTGNNVTGGQVSLQQSNPVVFPQLSIYISTAFLPKIAIVQQSGIPQLTITTSQQTGFIGDVLTYSGTVANIGGATGRFNIVSSSCTAGQSVTVVPSTTGDVAPGASAPITFTVTSGGTNAGIKSCVITASAVNDPTKTSTATLSTNWNLRCLKSCGVNTHLDAQACACVCDLPGTAGVNWFWNADQTACTTQCAPRTCTYGQDMTTCNCNPPPTCTLVCNPSNLWQPNQACNGCECKNTEAGAPNGYHLNHTTCVYDKNGGTGGGGLTQEELIGLGAILGVVILIGVGVYVIKGD